MQGMKLTLDQPCIEPFDRTSDLKVLIASEDSVAAERACAVLENIGLNCGLEGRLIYAKWNFEVLTITSLRAVASREAAAADLVIIAVHDVRTLSQKVADWVRSWAGLRKNGTEAMAVMAAAAKNSGPAQTLAQLRECAKMARMDFLFQMSHGDAMKG
jgi:hypothetical protein